MAWQEEFPDFMPEDMPTIPEGFIDQAWHNDAMPHFLNAALRLDLWIDYADRENRESPDFRTFRFSLYRVDADGAWLTNEAILWTDDWDAILAKIALVAEEVKTADPVSEVQPANEKETPPRPIGCELEIHSYLHCGMCVSEILAGASNSPRDYARLSIGWTPQGLQVWCNRHDCNVVHIDFENCVHPANTLRKTDN